ncbi:MAG: LacI family DNA-binding transcriptional regulator [Opitutaceae bacterium]|jgi:LacI family transcriptional regulator
MPNQREIARQLGIAQITVSRALSNSPLVTPETRRRVLAVAEKLGYRANPYVTALMANIRAGRCTTDQGCLAIISDASSKKSMLSHEAYRTWWEYAEKRAHLRGYRVEAFLTGAPGMSGEKVNRILTERGIRGVIIGNCSGKFFAVNRDVFDWDRYACATPMEDLNTYGIDCVCTDCYHNAVLAFQRTLARGYQRIGLVLPKSVVSKTYVKEWLGGYLGCQQWVPQKQRLAPFLGSPNEASPGEFAAWYRRWKPDVLLCLWGEEMQWISAMGLTFDQLAIVCMNRPPNSFFSGVEENNERVGEMLCDTVVQRLTNNEHGFPAHRSTLLIKGTWMDGQTLPLKKRVRAGKNA